MQTPKSTSGISRESWMLVSSNAPKDVLMAKLRMGTKKLMTSLTESAMRALCCWVLPILKLVLAKAGVVIKIAQEMVRKAVENFMVGFALICCLIGWGFGLLLCFLNVGIVRSKGW